MLFPIHSSASLEINTVIDPETEKNTNKLKQTNPWIMVHICRDSSKGTVFMALETDHVQLILEQEFEWERSTYTQIFLNIVP